MSDPTLALRAAMQAYGLYPPDIIWDGTVHRFPGAGKRRGNSGWYCAFPDRKGCSFGDHAQGVKEYWREKSGVRPSDDTIQKWRAEVAAKKQEREKKQDEAATACKELWQKSTAALEHPYLTSKGINASETGLRVDKDGALLIPMKAAGANKIVNIQRVTKKGAKYFYQGAIAEGTRLTLLQKPFDEEGRIYLCEGWATGWTIHKQAKASVVVCFMASNLESVAKYLRGKYPKASIVIAADNDRWSRIMNSSTDFEVNPGVIFAKQAAEAVEGTVAIPDFKNLGKHPTDFNDLFKMEGRGALTYWLDPNVADQAVITLEEVKPDNGEHWLNSSPFKILGFNGGRYYYLPQRLGQIVAVSAGTHGKPSEMFQLASVEWWRERFPSRTGAVSWQDAAAAVMGAAQGIGVFHLGRMRGRGAWGSSAGELIVHLGDRVVAPNEKKFKDPAEYTAGGHIYERCERLDGPSQRAKMDEDGARKLLECFEMLKWENEISAYLLAGWTVVAPLGAWLDWRPHVWVVGGARSGKTTVLQRLVRPLLGGMYQHFEGGSTEAGIRQTLGADCIPVLYDEAERTSGAADRQVEAVLRLMRSASSTDAKVAKGSPLGKALHFDVRSAFCLASIGGGMQQEADASRVSLLQLRAPTRGQASERRKHWAKLEPRLQHIDQVTGRQLLSRTFGLIRTGKFKDYLAACRTAVTLQLEDQRAGQQYGTLLAGAWSLMSDEPPEVQEVKEWMSVLDVGATLNPNEEPEGVRLLGLLLQARELVRGDTGPENISIGELIDKQRSLVMNDQNSDAAILLARLGIRMRDNALLLSHKSVWIRKTLSDTPFADSWYRVLKTVPDITTGMTMRFPGGVKTRTTRVPLDLLPQSDE